MGPFATSNGFSPYCGLIENVSTVVREGRGRGLDPLFAAGASAVVAHKFSTVLGLFLCDNAVVRALCKLADDLQTPIRHVGKQPASHVVYSAKPR